MKKYVFVLIESRSYLINSEGREGKSMVFKELQDQRKRSFRREEIEIHI